MHFAAAHAAAAFTGNETYIVCHAKRERTKSLRALPLCMLCLVPLLCKPAAKFPADEAGEAFMVDRMEQVFVGGGKLAVRQ